MKDKNWDVVVVGGANTDYLVRGSRLPTPGETAEGDLFRDAPGGKGANQAVAVARLGARVALLARVGTDRRGDELVARLTGEGVDTDCIVRDREAATGVALVMVGQGGEKQILVAPGANRQMAKDNVLAATEVLRDTRVVLVQLEIPLEAASLAIRVAGASGALVVLDPAPPTKLSDELLGLVDVIKPNATEAEELTGVQVKDVPSARNAAQLLLRRGVGAVAIQAGDEGNLLVWQGGEHWLPRVPVHSVDATGAGDAFAATLAVLLAEGRPLVEAGTFANAAAALATTEFGAMAALPKRKAIQALMSQQQPGTRRGSGQ